MLHKIVAKPKVLAAARSEQFAGLVLREANPDVGRDRAAIYGIAALAYLIAFVIAVKWRRIAHLSGGYWIDWGDQTQYIRSAQSFASGITDADHHWYPFLYSLLAAPFTLITPAFPFAILDALLFLAAFSGFKAVARELEVRPVTSLLLFIGSTVAYPRLSKRWIEPWTTTLSAALIWLAIAATLRIVSPRHPTTRSASEGARLGLLLALIPLARPAAVISAILGGAVLMRLRVSRSATFLVVAAQG